jgi:predicted nucleic acid-binding protein
VASSASPKCVVDTVVLRYFLLVDEADLMLELLEAPIAIPRIVYDDDDEGPQVSDDARSEITRSIAYQRRASGDPARDQDARRVAARNADRLERITALHTSGRVVIVDLTAEELALVGRLTSPTASKDFGLRFPLDAGEAACLAIAVERALVLATDDDDALRALEHHAPGHPYDRIRKLLIRAGNEGLCTPERANEIHREMRQLGFWDRDDPFLAG